MEVPTISDSTREIYPTTPLRLVVVEFRYPFSPRLGSEETVDFFQTRLGHLFPILEPMTQHEMSVTLGPGSPTQSQASKRPLLRQLSGTRDSSVTFSPTSMVVETTTYERFEAFLEGVGAALGALNDFGPPVGIERVGLRYIDEVRVPSPGEERDWHPWVDTSLVSAADLTANASGGLRPETWQGVVQLVGADGRGMLFRYGAMEGAAVQATLLRLKDPNPTGPFFLIDVDSFWAPDDLAPFDPTSLMEMCTELHDPVRGVFEAAITDQLRDEVLRKGTPNG